MFLANGPLKIDEATKTCKHNDYSWNHQANLLYIEAPAGVGFSEGDLYDQTNNDMTHSGDLFAAV